VQPWTNDRFDCYWQPAKSLIQSVNCATPAASTTVEPSGGDSKGARQDRRCQGSHRNRLQQAIRKRYDEFQEFVQATPHYAGIVAALRRLAGVVRRNAFVPWLHQGEEIVTDNVSSPT